MVEVSISKDLYGRTVVSFPYDPLLVSKVKTIDGRRWHPNGKYWSFPGSDETLEKILKVFEHEEIHLDSILKTLAFKVNPAPMPAPLRRARPGIKCGVKDTPSPLVGEGQGEGYNFEDLRRELVSRKYSYTPHFCKSAGYYNVLPPHFLKRILS
jgi:hypothetical protein